MSEPSYHPSAKDPMPTSTIALHDVRTGLPHEGQLGEGVTADGPGHDSAICIRLRGAIRGDLGVWRPRGASVGLGKARMGGWRKRCARRGSWPAAGLPVPQRRLNVHRIFWLGSLHLRGGPRSARRARWAPAWRGAVVSLLRGRGPYLRGGRRMLAPQTHGARSPRQRRRVHPPGPWKAKTRLPRTCGRFTTGHGNRNSWSHTREPSTA